MKISIVSGPAAIWSSCRPVHSKLTPFGITLVAICCMAWIAVPVLTPGALLPLSSMLR